MKKNVSVKTDTLRLREVGYTYFTTIETLSDICNISVKAAEVLLFIFNFNRTYKKSPTKKKIETHLNYKNIKSQLDVLNRANLIETVNHKYYHCTETSDISDIETLNRYVVTLHSIDDWSAMTFLDFMTFVHAIETVNGLETPLTSRRTLVRCFCVCEQFRVSDIQTVISRKKLACMYARDIKKILPILEEIYQRDTFFNHVRDTDRQNAIYEHQCSQFSKARAYVLDYETTNKKTHHTYTVRNTFKKQLDEETLEISDRAIEMRKEMSDKNVIIWLYSQIVTKKMSEYRFQSLTEAVYWADKTDCSEIE